MKPHIDYYKGDWFCYMGRNFSRVDILRSGNGASPKEAYDDWKAKQ